MLFGDFYIFSQLNRYKLNFVLANQSVLCYNDLIKLKGGIIMKKRSWIALIVSLTILIFAFTSCHQTPAEDLELPSEDCVMVYTISENEYIRILCNGNSDFNYYGEWVKGEKTEAVYFNHYLVPSMFPGDGGLACYIEIFDPDEKDHVHSSSCNHTYSFEKGAMKSSYLINPKTEEKIPITFSIDKNVDFYFSWVSQTYIDFFNMNNKVYKEESQNFWYDFEVQKGEWITNGKTIPIRMEFIGITPQEITLHIYDISEETEHHILAANGEITDENTFISAEISGTMFYKNSVQELTIVRKPKT